MSAVLHLISNFLHYFVELQGPFTLCTICSVTLLSEIVVSARVLPSLPPVLVLFSLAAIEWRLTFSLITTSLLKAGSRCEKNSSRIELGLRTSIDILASLELTIDCAWADIVACAYGRQVSVWISTRIGVWFIRGRGAEVSRG